MPTRRGNYLLRESNESHFIPMKFRLDQLSSALASIQTQLKDITLESREID